MKTLLPTQYDFLVAIERRDYQIVAAIANSGVNPPDEMWQRGLYLADLDPTNPDWCLGVTARLTPAGKDALMCYRAIHNLT